VPECLGLSSEAHFSLMLQVSADTESFSASPVHWSCSG